jgi:xanthosine utilization system XapX-like protein
MQATPRVALTTLLALLLGYGLMEMGNTLQGTPLSVRGQLARFTPRIRIAVRSAKKRSYPSGSHGCPRAGKNRLQQL